MWIVRIALDRPYTFIVPALLILILSPVTTRDSLHLFTNRYKGGVDTYLQVITAQTTELANERNAIDILRQRIDASVLLVKALGGGWDASKLPTFGAQRVKDY